MSDTEFQPAERRGRKKAAFCMRGHPLSGSNVYVTPSTGRQNCRACMRERDRRDYQADQLIRSSLPSGPRQGAAGLARALAKTGTAPADTGTQPIRPAPLKLFAIQVEWPLTLCSELPWSVEMYSTYRPVNG